MSHDDSGTFREIPGFPGYRISRDGCFQSCWRKTAKKGVRARGDCWRTVKGTATKRGYRFFDVIDATGKRKYLGLHQALLLAFVGPCPDGQEACHRDDDRSNNDLSNLYYATHAQNMRDCQRNTGDRYRPRGENHSSAILTQAEVDEIREKWKRRDRTQKEIAGDYGVSQQVVNFILTGRTWKG